MCRWYLINVYVSDIKKHMSYVRERHLLFDCRDSLVHELHSRLLPPVYGGD